MPVKPKQYNLETVRQLASRGLSMQQCAAALGCHRDTFRAHLQNDSAFSASFELGQADLANEIGSLLLDAARAGSVESMRFLAQSRLGWKPTAKLESEMTLEAGPTMNIILTNATTAMIETT